MFTEEYRKTEEHKPEDNEMFRASHLMILLTYSILSLILIGEGFLLSWETWAYVLILAGVVLGWGVYIRQALRPSVRLWVYSILMMVTYFYYGTHETSTYDLATVMLPLIMLYTMTGVKGFVLLCQGTFLLTYFYDIFFMLKKGVVFDSLMTTRTLMHVVVIMLAGWIAQIIIDRWGRVLRKSDSEIKALREGTERLNDFLASVSHELRTPVNAIIGITSLCIEKASDPQVKNDMISVRIAGKRMANQIGDILDYSEIDRKQLANNYDDYMIASVLSDVLEELRFFISPSLEVILDVDRNIPRVMSSDAEKIKKIIRHLMFNGICYTEKGGILVRLYGVKEEYGINLCIEVTDTGIGMDKQELEHIYERFYKGNPGHTGRIGGLGLGLSIVHGFVSSLGGFMNIESRPKVGTTVRVSLPQKVINDSPALYVENREKLRIGTFFRSDKFTNPQVREFYNTTVRNIARDMGAAMHWVDSIEKLMILNDSIKLTHLFIGREEYEENAAYMERLATKMVVVVVAHHLYSLPRNSKAYMMKKPFYSFPLVRYMSLMPGSYYETDSRLSFKGARVLVVDDEPMNIIVAEGIFSRYDMDTDCAYSGAEAVEKCGRNKYDLVFMDHMMPGMDGIEAMKRIRSVTGRDRKEMPVVVFTANAVSNAKKTFLAEGFDDFISKPIEKAELERVLRRLLPEKLMVVDGEAGYNWECRDRDILNAGMIRTMDEYTPPGPGFMLPGVYDSISPDPYMHIKSAGVDPDKGMEYCQHDEEFYRSIMMQFARDYEGKRANLENAFSGKDYRDYEIYVHALKSTSKTLGATALSELAFELEKCAGEAENDSVELSVESHEKLILLYEELVKAIEADAQLWTEGEDGDDGNDEDDEIMEFFPGE